MADILLSILLLIIAVASFIFVWRHDWMPDRFAYFDYEDVKIEDKKQACRCWHCGDLLDRDDEQLIRFGKVLCVLCCGISDAALNRRNLKYD